MAIVWANAGGNWSDTTIWKFYNEDSQQIEDYGQVPQVGDYVYANGNTILMDVQIRLGRGTVSNATNPYTSIGGGYFNKNSGITLVCNLEIANQFHNLEPYNNNNTGNQSWNITGDVLITGGGYNALRPMNGWNAYGDVTINGNVVGLSQNTRIMLGTSLVVNGNVTNCAFINRTGGSVESSVVVNGNVYEDIVTSVLATGISISFNINGDLTVNSTCQISDKVVTVLNLNGTTTYTTSTILVSNTITTLNVNSELNILNKISSGTITTLNNNGTINTSAPLATNLTTLNLNGTINTSNDTIADYPIGTTNIQEGSHVTYTQQQPLGWGELNAPDDFEFEYSGSGVSTSAYMIVNKNLLSQSYPQPSYVVSGTTYGDSSQFTGTMEQPDESVVLKDYVYDGGNKTGTLDTSNLDVPSDLTTQFNNITNKLGALQSRLSIADIIQALTQYTAVKVSDLASISIDKQDVKDAMDEYHAVTEEYVAACLGENIGS